MTYVRTCKTNSIVQHKWDIYREVPAVHQYCNNGGGAPSVSQSFYLIIEWKAASKFRTKILVESALKIPHYNPSGKCPQKSALRF